ncbi:MAG: hypothetical protein H0V83_00625 [Rubrobacter sp.]|nr:hypothetical protein [Rubrobacter sp.]
MRRIIAGVSVVTVMFAASVAPAFAAELGPSACKSERPGQYISHVAQEDGHSGYNNPGNAHYSEPPFVPFITNENNVACNPNVE